MQVTDNALALLLCLVGAGLPLIWRGLGVAAKKSAGTSDQDWLLGAWQMAAELGGEMGLAVQVGLTPTTRKGVWRTTVRVVHVVDGRPAGVVVQARAEYPNASSQGLGPHLLSLLHDADKLLADEINAERLKLP